MPRESLTKHISQIQDEVLLLGSMVEQAMLMAVDSLKRRDRVAARAIPQADQQINEKRFAIENAILILIATQQPMAHDLRILTAMLEVITELERMGDYAKGIAKVVIRLDDVDIPIPIRDIEQMAERAVSMLHKALTAFIAEDASLASAIPTEDDEVDRLYTQVYHFIVQSMIANPASIDHANLLMWVAHNIERMADRVTNICERTVFIATGELLEIDSSDDETDDNLDY
jgi:phosphate transport system protein